MKHEEFEAASGLANTKSDGEWRVLPDSETLGVHVASAGVGLSITRVERLKLDGGLVYLQTVKEETFVVRLDEVFAVVLDSTGGDGRSGRKAGFAS